MGSSSSSKKTYLSKTLWVNAIVAVSAIAVPGVSEYISAHPEVITAVFAGVNILLRLITKDKLSLEE